MKDIILAGVLLFMCSCATEPHFFMRDSAGNLIGPLSLKTGSLVEVGSNAYKIDVPKPGELAIMDRMRTIVLPYLAFSNAPLTEVEQTLYFLQRQTIGDQSIPVYFAPSFSTPQNYSERPGMETEGNFAELCGGIVDTSSCRVVITFSAKKISLDQAVRILGSMAGLDYVDIRNGTVTLRPAFSGDHLTNVPAIADSIDAGVAHQFQQEVDSVFSTLASLITPEYLSLGKSDQRRIAGEFDAMSFFQVFTNISIQEGYALDYVQTQWGMGSSPVLYARQASVKPYMRPTELLARKSALQSNAVAAASVQFADWQKAVLFSKKDEESVIAMQTLCRQVTHITIDRGEDEYLSHIFISDKPIAYLEFVALYLLGEQFYLGWHARYNDTRIICTQNALDQIRKGPEPTRKLTESDRFILSSIDPTPSFRRQGDEVHLSLVTFSKWGGLSRRRFVITQKFPHQMSIGADDVLWRYFCSYVY